ncbi:MAG: DUF2927 domain-containing protein [Pseudomonadota bacterium]
MLTSWRGLVSAAVAAATLTACGPGPQEIEASFKDYHEGLVIRGLMRDARAPSDAPFTRDDLVENYIRIALGREAIFDQEAKTVPLARWVKPIRYRVYGPGADAETRAAIDAYARRLVGLTGHEIREWSGEAEATYAPLDIFVANNRQRRSVARDALDQNNSGWIRETIQDFLTIGSNYHPCYVRLYVGNDGIIDAGVVLIRSETQGLFRQACIEEELAQALGLGNDDPRVRPSIFNDDQEFALLTAHDELLLRIHYDDRLRPGMDEAEVRAVIDPIVREVYP